MSTKNKTLLEIEKEAILAALKRNQNNKLAAARELGVTPTTIRNKLKSYGLVIVREVIAPDPADNAGFQPFKLRD